MKRTLAESSFTAQQAYRMIVDATREQEKKMRAMLADISRQARHCGHQFSPEQWKIILLYHCGYGPHSSHLSIADMTKFINYLHQFGDRHRVKFRNEEGLIWKTMK